MKWSVKQLQLLHSLNFSTVWLQSQLPSHLQLSRDVEKYGGGAAEEGSVQVACSVAFLPAGGRWQLFLVPQRSAHQNCWFSLTGDLLMSLDDCRLTRGYTPGFSGNNYKVRRTLSSCGETTEPNVTPLGVLWLKSRAARLLVLFWGLSIGVDSSTNWKFCFTQ